MFDRKGTFLENGQSVNVPEPNNSDKHQHSFKGIIIDVLESRGTVIVEDQDCMPFEIEADRVVAEDL